MKNKICLVGAAASLLALSCSQNLVPDAAPKGERVTIKAGFQEDAASKVTLEAAENKLELKWAPTDVLTIVGASGYSDFTIKEEGYGEKYSEFEGTAPEGTSFDILLPGGENGYRSVSDISAAAFDNMVQSGNASTAHLKYLAWIEGADTFHEIVFSDEWAAQHGATFHHTGAMKVYLKVPVGTETVKSLTISGFPTLNFENTEVGADQLLTAYLMTPATEVNVSAGEELTLSLVVNNDKTYSKRFTPGAVSFKPGKMNLVKLNDGNWDVPQGERYNPYELRTVDDLKAMKSHLVAQDTVFFKLMNDIDLAGDDSFTGVNSSNYEFIHLDGQGFSIKNFHTGTAGFFNVFQGVLENIKFTDVALSNGTRGILGLYAGLSNNKTPAYVRNVTVTGSATGITAANAAGMFSTATGGCHFTDCSVDVTLSTSAGYCGGLVAQIANGAQDVIFRNCTAKVNITSTSGDGRVGGIVGASAYRNASTAAASRIQMLIDNCSATGSITAAGNFVGGIIGYGTDVLAIGDCSVDMSITNTKSYTGGILGTFAYISPNTEPVTTIFGKFTVKGTLKGTSVSGFAGYVGNCAANLAFKDSEIAASIEGTVGVGGFAGFGVTGWSFENCKVTGPITATGSRQGGFVPTISGKAIFRDCVMVGDVDGTSNGTGGFVGMADGAEFTRCSFNGNVTTTGTYAGGLVGNSQGVASTYYQNQVKGSVTAGSYAGGILGYSSTANTKISECYADASVTVTSSHHAAGICAGANVKIDNCVSKGEVKSTSSDKTVFGVGGIISYAGNRTEVVNCYSTSDVSGNAAVGGIIGGQGYVSQSTSPSGKVSGCIAWNKNVTLNACETTAPRRGAGAITGYAPHHVTLENCWRRSDMVFTNPYGQVLYDQENSSSEAEYIANAGTHYDATTELDSGTPSYSPYHGKAAAADATVSSVAKSLSWDEDIWDLSAAEPALKWMSE